ncbi:MAG TPA: zinc-binding dehydrogenase [Chloroflexota bacterium]|nr:zinc-binding dehydrogenase [Chloroflexota bacterium]
MKALVFQEPAVPAVTEVNPPDIGPDEILVRSRAVGICHSDFELLDGHYIIPVSYPIIPGHEWSGEIVEVGKAVTSYKPGDRVVGECVIGQDHFGFSISGAAAEYFKVRPEWLHRLPDELSYRMGALVEPFTVAYYATVAANGIDAGDSTVIFGAGPIGLCCLAATHARGGRTIVIEPSIERRGIARRLGADATVSPADGPLDEQIRTLTDGRGADVILEASGVPAAMAAALEVAGHGARIVNIGINVGDAVPARLGLIQSKALRLTGIIGSPNVWPRVLRFLAQSKLDLTPIVTATFPLEGALDALAAARDTRANVKVQVVNE